MTTTINASNSGSGGLVQTADASGVLALQTAGTTAVTVDASQRVGIGTTSPAATLNVYNATSASFQLDGDSSAASRVTRYSTDATGPTNVVRKARGTLASPTAVATSDDSGGFYMQAYGGTNFRNVARIDGLVQTYTSDTNIAGALRFYTNAGSTDVTERMRIDSEGDLLLNTTSTNNNEKMRIKNSNDSRAIAFQSASAAECGYIYINAGGTGVTYSTSSDYRLKENIAPMTGALAKVAQLKPVTYTWKINGSYGQGFIAHELAEVVPDCVTGDKDAVATYTDENGNEATRAAYQGIDTSFLVATLTAAIQEQQALITQQAAAIEALTTRITALEGTPA